MHPLQSVDLWICFDGDTCAVRGPQAGELKTWETESPQRQNSEFQVSSFSASSAFQRPAVVESKTAEWHCSPGGGETGQSASNRQCRDAKPAPPMPTPQPPARRCPVAYWVPNTRHNSNSCGSMSSRSGTSRQIASPASHSVNVKSV